MKSASSAASFKHGIKQDIKEPLKFYNVGTRKGHVLHARLRLECNSLNADLYRKHIVNSPPCQCGHFESAAHFLLHCPILMNERQSFLPGNLRFYNAKGLLFGREKHLRFRKRIILLAKSRLYLLNVSEKLPVNHIHFT